MSIKLMAQVWDEAKSSGSELLVLLALADHANDNGVCWPSIPRLAKRARLSERQTQRVIQKLHAQGYIEIISKGDGRSHPTVYRLCIKDDKMSPFDEKRVTSATERVTSATVKGDIAMSPEPSLESPIESSSLATVDEAIPPAAEAQWRTVVQALHKYGVTLNAHIQEQYQEMLDSYGLDAVLVGLKNAADNGKAGRLKYARTCIESAADGYSPGKHSGNLVVQKMEGEEW